MNTKYPFRIHLQNGSVCFVAAAKRTAARYDVYHNMREREREREREVIK